MILARLRRSRSLLLVLLGLSPAGLGTLLPVVHPCPVDAPWLATHHQTAPAGHHGHHDADSAPATEHTCTCIGSCVGSAVPARSLAPIEARIAEIPSIVVPGPADSTLQLEPLASFLPPSTAPPLV